MDINKLKDYEFLRHLTQDQIIVLMSKAELLKLKPGDTLINAGDEDGEEFYLLAGELDFKEPGAYTPVRTLHASSPDAFRPLIRKRPRAYTVAAHSPAAVLKIKLEDLKALLKEAPTDNFEVKRVLREDQPEGRQVFFDIYEDLRNNKLNLPSLPEVAMKIRQLIDEGNSASTIAKAVTTDPVIAAKLIRAANSPLFRGVREFTTCTQAIVRIGLKTTKQLVMTFTVKELFRAKHTTTRKRMEELWNHSIEIAAICYVLAKETGAADPEQALLAGLLHDIGTIPLLTYAENYPTLLESASELAKAVKEFRSEVGGIILQRWGFDENMINAAKEAEHWKRDHNGKADLADLVIVAQLHLMIVQRGGEDIPSLEEIPAFKRLSPDAMSAERSLAMLREAHEQVVETRHMLAG